MAGHFLQRRGVFVVAVVCIGLTILSYSIQHWGSYGPASVRALVSLVAIAVTTFLALRTQAADLKLREQAGLLEITHDAVIVRDMSDVITYWNRGQAFGLEGGGQGKPPTISKLMQTLASPTRGAARRQRVRQPYPANAARASAKALRMSRSCRVHLRHEPETKGIFVQKQRSSCNA